MAPAKLSAKGWVVIPAEYRRKYGLRPGGVSDYVFDSFALLAYFEDEAAAMDGCGCWVKGRSHPRSDVPGSKKANPRRIAPLMLPPVSMIIRVSHGQAW